MLLDELTKFGLTHSEAKAYKALVGLKEARASDVSKLSKLPRNKIYFIMEGLHRKGFVEIIPEKIMRFRAIPFEIVFRSFVEDTQKRINEISKTGEKLASELKNMHIEKQDSGEFTVFKGRKTIYRKINDMLSHAKNSVFLCVDAEELRSLYSIQKSRKICIEAVTNVNFNSKNIIKKWLRFSTVRHHNSLPPTRIIVVDRKEVILFHLSSHMALYSNDANFAEMTMVLNSTLLKNSIPARDKITEIETGKPVDEIKFLRSGDESLYDSKATSEICSISSEIIDAQQKSIIDADRTVKGVKLKYLFPITRENLDVAKKISQFAEVRHIDKSPMNLRIIDDKQCLLQHSTKEPWIFSQSSDFVASMKIFFEKILNKAVPAKERIAQIEKQIERESLLRFAD